MGEGKIGEKGRCRCILGMGLAVRRRGIKVDETPTKSQFSGGDIYDATTVAKEDIKRIRQSCPSVR